VESGGCNEYPLVYIVSIFLQKTISRNLPRTTCDIVGSKYSNLEVIFRANERFKSLLNYTTSGKKPTCHELSRIAIANCCSRDRHWHIIPNLECPVLQHRQLVLRTCCRLWCEGCRQSRRYRGQIRAPRRCSHFYGRNLG